MYTFFRRLRWRAWQLQQLCLGMATWPLRAWDARVERRRSHELALARVQSEAFATALTTINQQNASLMTEVVKSSQEASKVLQQWLDGFKVVEMPKHGSTAVTDEVEALLERERRGDLAHGVEALPQDLIERLTDSMGQPPPQPSYRPIPANPSPKPLNLSTAHWQ